MTQVRYKLEAEYVEEMAHQLSERTGEFLFRYLRHGIAETIRGTKFDPSDKNLTYEEIVRWLEAHIIYDNNGNMIYFVNGDDIIWEAGNR